MKYKFGKGVELMDKPIRVLQILGIVAGGGAEAVVMNYYKYIDHEKVQFDFVVHEDNPVDITAEVEAMGGHVYKVPAYSKHIMRYVFAIYQILKKHPYCILHANMNTISAFSLFAAWLAGVKVRILHNHSTSVSGETKRNLMKLILRPLARCFANRYFACSMLAADWMYGVHWHTEGNVQIIKNAIDLGQYAFSAIERKRLRAEFGVEGKVVIGNVGRFMYQKNHDFLIDIFVEVLKQQPEAVLLLIGDGPLQVNIKNRALELGISDAIIFLGLRDDVHLLYNAMDVFCFPSRYEGLGLVIVEAQANGLPVVTSRAVPEEAVVLPGKVYYCSLQEQSAIQWANELLRASQDKKREVSKEAFQKAGYDIQDAARTLEKIYDESL